MERARGFEPLTASLEGWNSTTELRPHALSVLRSTEDSALSLETKGLRRTSALGSRDSTLVYSPLEFSDLPSQAVEASGSSKRGLVGRQGFEPWKPMATDLQSAPFVHLGTCPNITTSLDSFSYAQKQTIPLTVFPPEETEWRVTVQDGQAGYSRKQAILRTIFRDVK